MSELGELLSAILLVPLMLFSYGWVLDAYQRADQSGLDSGYSLLRWVGVALMILVALVAVLNLLPKRRFWWRTGGLVVVCLLIPWGVATLIGETWWWHALPLSVGALLPAAAVLLHRPLTRRIAWLERLAVMLFATALAIPAGSVLHLTLPNEPAVATVDRREAYPWSEQIVPADCPGVDGAKAAVLHLGDVQSVELVSAHVYGRRTTVPCEDLTLRGATSAGQAVYYWLTYRHGQETDPWVVRATLELTDEHPFGTLRAPGIADDAQQQFRDEARGWELQTHSSGPGIEPAICADRTCQPLP